MVKPTPRPSCVRRLEGPPSSMAPRQSAASPAPASPIFYPQKSRRPHHRRRNHFAQEVKGGGLAAACCSSSRGDASTNQRTKNKVESKNKLKNETESKNGIEAQILFQAQIHEQNEAQIILCAQIHEQIKAQILFRRGDAPSPCTHGTSRRSLSSSRRQSSAYLRAGPCSRLPERGRRQRERGVGE